jgi:hypothetical protein
MYRKVQHFVETVKPDSSNQPGPPHMLIQAKRWSIWWERKKTKMGETNGPSRQEIEEDGKSTK